METFREGNSRLIRVKSLEDYVKRRLEAGRDER